MNIEIEQKLNCFDRSTLVQWDSCGVFSIVKLRYVYSYLLLLDLE